jgi:hypothetical protein
MLPCKEISKAVLVLSLSMLVQRTMHRLGCCLSVLCHWQLLCSCPACPWQAQCPERATVLWVGS